MSKILAQTESPTLITSVGDISNEYSAFTFNENDCPDYPEEEGFKKILFRKSDSGENFNITHENNNVLGISCERCAYRDTICDGSCILGNEEHSEEYLEYIEGKNI